MAVLGRVLFSSAERVDLPDLASIDSYSAGDWKFYMQSLVGTTNPYILSGFDVINPATAIGLPTCSIRVADSIAYFPSSSAGPFFYGLPTGNPNSAPLIPQLRTNTTNYVYLTLSTFSTAADIRALWDPDRNSGAGAEFTQEINTESVIQAQVNVSTGSFPSGTLPLAIIVMGPTAIVSIEDARNMFFRLGSGGINPNPSNTYAFRDLPNSGFAREEPSSTISSSSAPNPFQGGDKNIPTMKEWMDAVMTKLRELGGTNYWYEDVSTFTLTNIFHDALTTTFKSKGAYTYSSSIPGQLSWSEDIYVKDVSSPKDVVIRASGASPLSLSNEQVAFLILERNLPINGPDEPVAFTVGQAYVNAVGGSVGSFGNLRKGDWIKKFSDDNILWCQIQDFYNVAQSPGPVSGSSTTAANARSVILYTPYQGNDSPASGDRARFDRGEYQPTDIQQTDRDDSLITEAAGNFMWFAVRSDTNNHIGSISTVSLSGTVTSADGTTVTVTSTGHGLINNDRITVTAPAGQAGTFSVQVIDVNTFNFKNTNTSTGAFTAFYGLVTTVAYSVAGFQIESANHGFDSGDTMIVSGTVNFNGASVVNVRSSTQVQFPIGASHATETTGLATLARMDVRTEEGVTKIVQGEVIDVGAGTIENMQEFIGMDSLSETYPTYVIPGGYGTFNNGANYFSSITDNLTARVSKLTAMMADKAQDKTVKYLTEAIEATNVTDSTPSLQDLSFSPPGSTLTLLQPGSPGNAVVTLPSSGSPLQLAVNQSAYVSVNRNAASTPGIIIANTSSIALDENVFVIASRLSDNYVYLWNGAAILNTVPIVPTDPSLIEVTFCDPVSTTLPTGNPVTEDGISVNAGDTALFTNLSSGANEVYKAVGVGTNITSWTTLYKFNGNLLPTVGDLVYILKGNAFAIQIGKWNGTAWVFNDKVRYFNGADYWEQSNIVAVALSDATTADVFSVAWAGSQHMIVDFSVTRSTSTETGTLHIVTDGTNVAVNGDSAYLNGNTGTTFTGFISGSNLHLQYTTTATGSPAVMRFTVKRWSDTVGGPGGVPSYSGAPSVPTPAAPPVTGIQFNTGGVLAANSNFEIDTVDLSMNYNGLRQGVLSSGITVLNNQSSFVNLFALPNTYPYMILSYSISKESFARTGTLTIAYDGTNVVCNDAYVETGITGVTLQAIMSGSNIQFQYESTNGVGAGTFKYSWRKWS